MGQSKVIIRDKGWKELRAKMSELDTAFVTVGVHGGDDKHGEKTTPLALVAAVNEFGSQDGHVPERSFLRSTIDSRQDDLRQVQRRVLSEVVGGRQSVRGALSILGMWVQAAVQRTITKHPPPPNAPATIAKKGSSGTLIDSGQLRQGISYEVHIGGSAEGAAGAPAAPIEEEAA